MKRADVIQWLQAAGSNVQASQGRGGWIISDCPFGAWRHDNGKSGPDAFGVRLETGLPLCNCFSCGFHGDPQDVLIELRHLERTQPSGTHRDFQLAQSLVDKADEEFEIEFDDGTIEDVLAQKTLMHEFPESWLASFPAALACKPAVKYLHDRNVPDEISTALDLRWDGSQKRVCFPVRDFAGRLMGLHGRDTTDKQQPRYRMYQHDGHTNPLIWLGESWVDVDRPILVVEGPFDIASAARVYRNIVSPLFALPSFEKIGRMADCLEVVTMLDRGKAGDLGRARFLKSLPGSTVTNLIPAPGIKDPGVATIEQLQDMLGPYLPLDDPVY